MQAALAPRGVKGIAAAAVLAAPAASGADTAGVRSWLTDNIVPLGVMITGCIILYNARKKDHASTVNMVGGALIGLAVIGVGVGGFAPSIGSWLVSLIWHGSSTKAAGN
ncbi:hypothetical protein RVR_P216 (plasmid) [Actinacidiphila reveromycinica]|uniref:Uncharacterized protein n=1 Tax=Actinacidiphila reveromycinica TaxID=659352 RepID=A0A7R6QDY6_9ACTN|nr:hypothetical protein RVR_P216 [Streptomyces sp. SN-593]